MASTYDAVVVGIGAMGSAAVYHMARRGLRVLGLEQFDIPHDLGSSHGLNRIIRLAYYEHPDYVPLLRRAYELWRQLERDAGEQLLWTTGSLDIGDPDSEVFAGSRASCVAHDLTHDVLDAAGVNRRFPGYALPGDLLAVYQPDGGFLAAEGCVVRHVERAIEKGAEVHTRELVIGLDLTADSVEIRTPRDRYQAASLVCTAGPWTGKLLPEMAELAVPERQVLGWFQPQNPELFQPDVFPVFNAALPGGRYYGFPIFGIPGFKIGLYHHLGEETDADDVDRSIRSEDEEILRRAVRACFPEADGPVMSLKTCLFTNSPDEHFIVDAVSADPPTYVAAGFSGHGFKFASVIGEMLADLVTDGSTDHDLSRFTLERFESRGPR